MSRRRERTTGTRWIGVIALSLALGGTALAVPACGADNGEGGDDGEAPPDRAQDTLVDHRPDGADAADCTTLFNVPITTGVWTQLFVDAGPDVSVPPPRAYQAMSWGWTAEGATSLMHGGGSANSGLLADTWGLEDATGEWASLVPGPSPRGGGAMAYAGDPLADGGSPASFILFGGQSSSFLGDTWAFNGASWTSICPAAEAGPCGCGPCPRAYQAMAYDANKNQVVMFGGRDGTGPMQDTWSFAGGSWTLACSGPCDAAPCCVSPPARSEHAMAYDVARKVTVLFGGKAGDGTLLGDTWEWNGTVWTQMTSVRQPAARSGHVMAAGPPSYGVALFGGNEASGATDDAVWSWDGSDWTPLPIDGGSPPPRAFGAMATDQGNARLILFGGGGAGELNDTWSLALARTAIDGGSCRPQTDAAPDVTVDAGVDTNTDYCASLGACCPSLPSSEQSDCSAAATSGDETLCEDALGVLEATGSCP